MKWIKNGKILLLLSLIGVLLITGMALYRHYAHPLTAAVHPRSEIAAMDIGRIDINTAPADTLAQLPGITPRLAAQIVAYRTEHGAFLSPEDIRSVPGIGAKHYAAIQYFITTSSP